MLQYGVVASRSWGIRQWRAGKHPLNLSHLTWECSLMHYLAWMHETFCLTHCQYFPCMSRKRGTEQKMKWRRGEWWVRVVGRHSSPTPFSPPLLPLFHPSFPIQKRRWKAQNLKSFFESWGQPLTQKKLQKNDLAFALLRIDQVTKPGFHRWGQHLYVLKNQFK